jgi:acetyl-CoA acetyltransferase family protein
MEAREAVIVDTVRTAVGKRKGALANWHPSDLLGLTLRSLLERNDVDPGTIDDVVGGCVTQSGEQGCNVTRNAWVAQVLADRFGVTRDEMDAFALESHRRAAANVDSGFFDREVVPVPLKDEHGEPTGDVLRSDEAIRRGTSLEQLAGLPAVWESEEQPAPDITAGNSSPMSDGASAMLVADRATAERLGLPIRARFVHFAVLADDPVLVLSAPNPVTRKLLERTGMKIDEFDAIECNEAFAAIALMWAKEFRPDPERYNPRGGAIAIGHPLGASGVRLMTTMLNHLETTGGRFGFQTMCEGGGQANATVIERLG